MAEQVVRGLGRAERQRLNERQALNRASAQFNANPWWQQDGMGGGGGALQQQRGGGLDPNLAAMLQMAQMQQNQNSFADTPYGQFQGMPAQFQGALSQMSNLQQGNANRQAFGRASQGLGGGGMSGGLGGAGGFGLGQFGGASSSSNSALMFPILAALLGGGGFGGGGLGFNTDYGAGISFPGLGGAGGGMGKSGTTSKGSFVKGDDPLAEEAARKEAITAAKRQQWQGAAQRQPAAHDAYMATNAARARQAMTADRGREQRAAAGIAASQQPLPDFGNLGPPPQPQAIRPRHQVAPPTPFVPPRMLGAPTRVR